MYGAVDAARPHTLLALGRPALCDGLAGEIDEGFYAVEGACRRRAARVPLYAFDARREDDRVRPAQWRDDRVAAGRPRGTQGATDETAGAGDENLHVKRWTITSVPAATPTESASMRNMPSARARLKISAEPPRNGP